MSTVATGPNRMRAPARFAVLIQAGLCGLAAAVSIARAAGSNGAGPTMVASLAASLALIALGLTLRSTRWATAPLGAAIIMEFTVMLGPVAPPRLVNAIPLLFALGLATIPGNLDPGRLTRSQSGLRRIVAAASLALMLPIGVAYLVAINLVASFPDVLVSYALYTVLVATTIGLARQRSWWIATLPVISIGLFLLMVQLGATFRGWSG